VKLAAMQPYFFPYLGHFDLLHKVDVWVAYDSAQFIRHGWVNRNRVLHPAKGWQYITVPLKKHSYTAPINQLETTDLWQGQIFKQLEHYHMDAPHYRPVIQLLKEIFALEKNNLARLNIAAFRTVARYLGIATPIQVFSETNLKAEKGAENLALAICRQMGATEYINPPGGVDLYNPETFAQHGIKLAFQSFSPIIYPCGRYTFIPNLSIIDVMMWNSPEEIRNYLEAQLPAIQPP